MYNKSEFQIVCIDCGCLSIKIDDPVYASRDAIVSCSDCGGSRGTLGDLRDLSVKANADVTLPAGLRLPCPNSTITYDPQSDGEISKRYGELQRLRRQVKSAEVLAAAIRGDHTRAADSTLRTKTPPSGHSNPPPR